jgi:hypothetical protein
VSVPVPPGDGMRKLASLFTDAEGLPELRIARQTGDAERLGDIEGRVRSQVAASLAAAPARRGRVAVGVGSRGIANIRPIVATVLDELRTHGFEPFIVPAMGSHGGGTPEGQLEVLASYGISERGLCVPVLATADTVVIGEVSGIPVAIDRHVVEAGAVFLINRIKPHTDFRGPIESGIAKMAAIGLSKQAGARAMHASGPDGLRDLMPEIGRLVSRRMVIGALGIVENEFDETMLIESLTTEEIGGKREHALLEIARAALPRLPFAQLDVLVIERIGKDISGTCIDPNIVGRWSVTGLREPEPLAVRCVAALELTEASHGNALGVGLVDIVPLRLARAIDLHKTYVNGMTSGWSGLARTRMPIVLENDRDVIASAASVSGKGVRDIRLAWIQDTLHTRVVAVSPALWDEAAADPAIELGERFSFTFDGEDRLVPLSVIAGEGPAAPRP